MASSSIITCGTWHSGRLGSYSFEAKVFDEPSEADGICGGRISKLCIRNADRQRVLIYDRGWDISPTARTRPLLQQLLKEFF